MFEIQGKRRSPNRLRKKTSLQPSQFAPNSKLETPVNNMSSSRYQFRSEALNSGRPLTSAENNNNQTRAIPQSAENLNKPIEEGALFRLKNQLIPTTLLSPKKTLSPSKLAHKSQYGQSSQRSMTSDPVFSDRSHLGPDEGLRPHEKENLLGRLGIPSVDPRAFIDSASTLDDDQIELKGVDYFLSNMGDASADFTKQIEERRIVLKRLKLLRQLCIIMHLVYTGFHIKQALVLEHFGFRALNMGFVVVDLLICVLLGLTFKKRMGLLKYCYHIFVYINLCMIYRQCDFEQNNSGLDEYYLGTFRVCLFATIMVDTFIFILMFNNNCVQYVIGLVAILLNCLTLIHLYSSTGGEGFNQQGFLSSSSVVQNSVFYYLYCIYTFINMNNDTYQQLKRSKDYQAEFRVIFQHLEESLLILEGKQMRFVNDQFLRHFKRLINKFKSIKPTEETKQAESDSGSRFKKWRKAIWQKVVKWTIKIFCCRVEEATEVEKPIHAFMLQPIFQEYHQELRGFENNRNHIENSGDDSDDEEAPAQARLFSLCDLLEENPLRVQEKVFVLLERQTSGFLSAMELKQNQYVKVKVSAYGESMAGKKIVQFKDVTTEILKSKYKNETQLLEMINACVSHELRNPLNSIAAINIEKHQLYHDLMAKVTALKNPTSEGLVAAEAQEMEHTLKKLQEGWKVQDSSCDIMTFLVQDLLDFAQIKAGKFRKNISAFNIRDAVEKVVCIQRKKAHDQGIGLEVNYINISKDPQIRREAEHSPIICTDQQRVMQVLLGLQSNAIKFTQQGSVTLEVRILEEEARFLQIAVVDTGIGIKYEDQDKLFKLFGFLNDPNKLNTKGIGLGLCISDQIVNQFDGQITFTSTPGKGSTFRFNFKLVDSDAEVTSRPRKSWQNPNEIEYKLDSTNLVFQWQPSKSSAPAREQLLCLPLEVRYVLDESEEVSDSISIAAPSGLHRKSPEIKVEEPSSFFSMASMGDLPEEFKTTGRLPEVPVLVTKASASGAAGPLVLESDKHLSQAHSDGDSSPVDRILIVDDQSFNIDAAVIILKVIAGLDTDRICDTALGGQKALSLVVENVERNSGMRCDYKLILMDCNMPHMDGYEATGLIRNYLFSKGLPQPIISAITGHSELLYIKKAINSGMNQVLSKPIKGQILKELVQRLQFQ